jgi:hypothetical protein
MIYIFPSDREVARFRTCHRAGGVIPIAGVLFLALSTIDVNVGVWVIKNRLTVNAGGFYSRL